MDSTQLSDFHTPKPSRFKIRTISSDKVSPDKGKVEVEESKLSHVDTEEGYLERDEASEFVQKLNMSGTHKNSQFSSTFGHKPEHGYLTIEEGNILRSCVGKLAQKLKDAKLQNEKIKLERQQDIADFNLKLKQANKHIEKLKTDNKKLNNQLVEAIEAIKMSCFSYELNKDDTEKLIKQLEYENKNLRK